MSPRLLKDLALKVDKSAGPASLLTSNEQSVPCEGEVRDLQVLAHQYKSRMSFVVADIGRDDIIIGGEVLEMQEGGFGPAGSGMYKMHVNGKVCMIPLIGEHAPPEAVTEVRGTKKALKLFRKHSDMIMAGRIWRKPDAEETAQVNKATAGEEAQSQSDAPRPDADNRTVAEEQEASSYNSQDEDAQRCKIGQEIVSTSERSKVGRVSTKSSSLNVQARTPSATHEGHYRSYRQGTAGITDLKRESEGGVTGGISRCFHGT